MVIVIYRPPGQLGNFCYELDMLLSHFPEDGTPLIVMGDLNIHPQKPKAADVFALVNTFDLSLVSTPPTHKAGNNLDLILTRNCTTDNILVTPLHVSDHFFIQLTVLIPRPSQSPPTLVTFRRNLRSLNPDRFSSLVSATLPPTQDLSICDADAATDSLCNTLSSCLDCLCPMSSRPARLSPSNPWLTDGIRKQRTTLRSAERKWRKSKTPSALAEYQNLLGPFSHSVTRAKINYYQEKLSNTTDTRKLFSTFKSLIYPPSPPPSTSLIADNFANFFTNKVAAISSQFSPPDDDIHLTSSNTALLSSFAILTEDDVSTLLLSNQNLGISGSALDWLCSYLSGRSFKVSWRGHLSNSHSLSTGVPQGSVLGPLLFSIYTSSLGAIIHSHGLSYHCYADDTQLFLSFPPDDSTVSSRIFACLSDISAWMSERHLQLNLSKTEVLVFPARPLMQHNISINIGSTVIVPTNSAKNLGVIIDDQLSFKDHISSVSRACRFALYNIRKIRPYITEYTTQLIVQALVTSRLDYCNALLMGLPISTIKPLQMIQNAAARLIFNQPNKTHVTPLFRSLHWLPVAARIRFKALSLAYRVVNSTAPAYLNSLIQVYNPSRPLRSAKERRLCNDPTMVERATKRCTLS
ncbi:hypothetical protein Q8A73_011076 [Channa argus]|nr:hypothetical protein Q8A73_011076 [Channa argus]